MPMHPTKAPTDSPTHQAWWNDGWHKHTPSPTSKPSVSPTQEPTTTAWWSANSQNVWSKSWGTGSNNWYTTTNAPQHECKTSFAYDATVGTCFDDLGFNRWGWSLGPFDDNTFTGNVTLSFDIYAGAAKCDIGKGHLVGELRVHYDVNDDEYTITWIVDAPFKFTGFHLNVDNKPLATNNGNGQDTVAPGQYTHVVDLNGQEVETQTINGNITGNWFIIAHADVCALPANW